jgi:hypothetical protein
LFVTSKKILKFKQEPNLLGKISSKDPRKLKMDGMLHKNPKVAQIKRKPFNP